MEKRSKLEHEEWLLTELYVCLVDCKGLLYSLCYMSIHLKYSFAADICPLANANLRLHLPR